MYYQNSRKILIIDPDRDTEKKLLSLFSSEGYQVEISEELTNGLQKLEEIKFDCLIMDVELPEMRGYEALPIIRTVAPKIDVIMTAARNTPELEARVREQDIFYYYIKSFGKEELRLAVHDVFKKLGKIKEVRRINGEAKIPIVDDDPGLNQIPMFMITGATKKTSSRYSPQTDGEYLEADDYVDKPVKATDLLERTKTLLDRYGNVERSEAKSMKEQENTPLYTIGITARLLGVCSATLRLWENKGVIKPSRIGKNRFYSKSDIDRLGCVKYFLQKMRINIAGVKEILDTKFCWEVKNCGKEVRRNCSVYRHCQKLQKSKYSK